MKKYIILLFLCLTCVTPLFAETIVLKSGQKVVGKITERTSEYIKVDIYGVSLAYYLDEIKSIEGEEAEELSQPKISSVVSGQEKSPAQVFEEVAPAIVVITAQLPNGTSQGSGFIVDRSGIIMTNFHVVAGSEEIEIKLKDGKVYPVTGIIEYNSKRDVCVLKIDTSDLTAVSLGNSNNLKSGQRILVIGAPLGLEYSITDGLFSGTREYLGQKSLQFSAPISPGNSGGPLLDIQGKVVGITTWTSLGGQNLNFAVPIDEAKGFIRAYPKMNMQEFSTKISKAYSFHNSGMEAFHSDNANLAIDYLKQAITVDPNYVEAYSNLGVVYLQKGMLDEAISELKKAITIDPQYADAYVNLGIVYLQKGMLDEAISELKKAITIDPQQAVAYINLGAAYGRKNMFDEAISEVKKAITFDPSNAAAHTSLGWGYYKKGMLDEAITELKKAITIDSFYSLAYINLAIVYFDAREYDLAVKHCEKAISLGHNVDPEFLEKLKPYQKKDFIVK